MVHLIVGFVVENTLSIDTATVMELGSCVFVLFDTIFTHLTHNSRIKGRWWPIILCQWSIKYICVPHAHDSQILPTLLEWWTTETGSELHYCSCGLVTPPSYIFIFTLTCTKLYIYMSMQKTNIIVIDISVITFQAFIQTYWRDKTTTCFTYIF